MANAQDHDEQSPLLGQSNDERLPNPHPVSEEKHKRRIVISSVLTFLFITAVVLGWAIFGDHMTKDALDEAREMLRRSPVIVSWLLLHVYVKARR